MGKFTVEQVEAAINKYEEDETKREYGNTYEQVKWGEAVEVPTLGKLELVEDFGGEGQGDDYWVVFKIGNQMFRKDGWYASYDGGELDGALYEVEPVQVSRTEYQRKAK